MAIIGFAVIYVPTVTSIVLEIMSLESKYQRNSFASALNGKHVVICGDLASISLKEFFDELFHEDHSNTEDQGNILQIVVLQPSKCILSVAESLPRILIGRFGRPSNIRDGNVVDESGVFHQNNIH
jgi:hypothetical protein